jgi:hypothetical protein
MKRFQEIANEGKRLSEDMLRDRNMFRERYSIPEEMRLRNEALKEQQMLSDEMRRQNEMLRERYSIPEEMRLRNEALKEQQMLSDEMRRQNEMLRERYSVSEEIRRHNELLKERYRVPELIDEMRRRSEIIRSVDSQIRNLSGSFLGLPKSLLHEVTQQYDRLNSDGEDLATEFSDVDVSHDATEIQRVLESEEFAEARPEERAGILAELIGKLQTRYAKSWLYWIVICLLWELVKKGFVSLVLSLFSSEVPTHIVEAPPAIVAESLENVWVVGRTMDARSGAGKTYSIVGQLPEGRCVRITHWRRDWSYVEWIDRDTKEGLGGWVYTRWLERLDPAVRPLSTK